MIDWKCIDCDGYKTCEMTGIGFCRENKMPAWMAYGEFYDKELGECKYHSSNRNMKGLAEGR